MTNPTDPRRDSDLVKGRNGNHRYNITPPPPPPEPKFLKDGVTLAKVQPKLPKPKHDTPSVTTISGLLDKAGLMWGAAKETALLAVYGREKWGHLEDEAAYEKLRTWFRHVWDLKAETGNIVHDVALSWALGETDVDLIPLIEYDRKGETRNWSDDEKLEVLRRVNGCLDALELFYLEQQPTWRYVEQPVIMPSARFKHGDDYVVDPKSSTAGCFDGDGHLRDFGNVLGDFKTGKRYPLEETLQLAGYQRSKLLATYDDNGHLSNLEDYDAPKKCVSIHLNDDGTYEVLPLPVNAAARARFTQLRRQYEFNRQMAAWEKEHPAPIAEESLEEQLFESLAGAQEKTAA